MRTVATDQRTAAAPGTAETTGCPRCGAALVSLDRETPWCEHCLWNLDAYDPAPFATWWQRRSGAFTHRIAYRLTMAQFRELGGRANGGGHRDPGEDGCIDPLPVGHPAPGTVGRMRQIRRWGRARFVAAAFAVLFYGLIAAIGAAGVWLIRLQFPNPMTIILGITVLVIALYLCPRVRRLPKDVETLTPEQAPALHALVARVAAALGTPCPTIVGVVPWFRAYTMAVGLRRRRALVIGLALWGGLEPQQRVAVLAHEMGHFAHGDIRRGPLIEPAMTSLARLSVLLNADRRLHAHEPPLMGLAAVIYPVVEWALRILSSLLYAAHLGVLAILLRDGQRREYLADQRAADLAGTRALAQVLDLAVSSVGSVVASRARDLQTYPGWRVAVQSVLRSENRQRMRRLRQRSVRRDASLWASHPPTGLRAWLVEAEPWRDPTFVLSAAESDLIDVELEGYYQRARRDLAQSGV
jgi:heat shock protein HtpX